MLGDALCLQVLPACIPFFFVDQISLTVRACAHTHSAGRPDNIRLLLSYGARVDIRNNVQQRPRDWIEPDDPDTLKALVDDYDVRPSMPRLAFLRGTFVCSSL